MFAISKGVLFDICRLCFHWGQVMQPVQGDLSVFMLSFAYPIYLEILKIRVRFIIERGTWPHDHTVAYSGSLSRHLCRPAFGYMYFFKFNK